MNAQNDNEEFVTEALVTFEKMETLVYDLLVAETWKSSVSPFFLEDMVNQTSLKPYFLVGRVRFEQ